MLKLTPWRVIVLALLGALGLWLFWVTRPAGWEDMARMTGVQVPAGAVMSAVGHPTEVVYEGTIDLKSDADVQEFVRLNGLTRMSEHVALHPSVHLGDVTGGLAEEHHAPPLMLRGHSDENAWEFVLVPAARRVSYVVLIQDAAGDLPWDSSDEGGKRGGK